MATSDYYIQDNADIENAKIDAAKRLYQTGDYNGALKLYLDMLNTSYSYKLYYEIGRCYYKLNDVQTAEDYFSRSVSLEDYKNPSYIFLGNIAYKKNDLHKAIEYWITSYSYKPDDEFVCLNLATAYFTLNMKFQAIKYYEKYLKYAKNKSAEHYLEIQRSINEFVNVGFDFYQKFQKALAVNDSETAIKALEYSTASNPCGFDANFALAKLYNSQKEYEKAQKYLLQALCIDLRSIDVLQMLSSVCANLMDITGSYCCLKRMLPLLIHNQKEYLSIIRTTKEISERFNNSSYVSHLEKAQYYYNENNYILALYEYENVLLINPELAGQYGGMVENLRRYINPESSIIKTCFEKALLSYQGGDYKKSNRYYTKIMTLSSENSSDYKLAKSRILNV